MPRRLLGRLVRRLRLHIRCATDSGHQPGAAIGPRATPCGLRRSPPDKNRRSATSFRKMGRKTELRLLFEEAGKGNAAAGGREDVRQEALVHIHVPRRQIASASRH